MKLYYTSTSPFVRKVLVTAHELGVADRIETTFLRPTPTKADPTLSKDNPLSKIPVLILADGTSLFDSAVICEYLLSIAPDQELARAFLPPSGPERFAVLRMQALCDGILEAAILVFYERLSRPKELHWAPWIEGQSEKANQALSALELEIGGAGFTGRPTLGQVCVAITLGWIEFRGVLEAPRARAPELFRWYDEFRKRRSMVSTEPSG